MSVRLTANGTNPELIREIVNSISSPWIALPLWITLPLISEMSFVSSYAYHNCSAASKVLLEKSVSPATVAATVPVTVRRE